MSSPKTIISGGQHPSEPPALDAAITRRVRLVVLDETAPWPAEDGEQQRRPGVRSARDKARFTGEPFVEFIKPDKPSRRARRRWRKRSAHIVYPATAPEGRR